MKRILLIGLILGLFTSNGYAQMVSQKVGTGKEITGRQTGQMMGQKEMMDRMVEMMNQMSGMMGRMPNMMMKVMPPPDIRKMMLGIMKDMSQQMMDMSKIMETGAASEKEMKMMQDKMAQMEKRVSELEAGKSLKNLTSSLYRWQACSNYPLHTLIKGSPGDRSMTIGQPTPPLPTITSSTCRSRRASSMGGKFTITLGA